MHVQNLDVKQDFAYAPRMAEANRPLAQKDENNKTVENVMETRIA